MRGGGGGGGKLCLLVSAKYSSNETLLTVNRRIKEWYLQKNICARRKVHRSFGQRQVHGTEPVVRAVYALRHPLPAKDGTNFSEKRSSLGWYSSLAKATEFVDCLIANNSNLSRAQSF
jgi:hypothetical protein